MFEQMVEQMSPFNIQNYFYEGYYEGYL